MDGISIITSLLLLFDDLIDYHGHVYDPLVHGEQPPASHEAKHTTLRHIHTLKHTKPH